MALKIVAQGVQNHVQTIWDKGLQNPSNFELVLVEQYTPPKDLVNEFEARRNELDRSLRGQKLQTIQAFIAPEFNLLKKILVHGFYRSLGNTRLAFSTDPSTAIEKAGGQSNHKLLLCRITLGREGTDYQLSNGDYYIDNLRGIMPSFLITFTRAGESVSLQTLDLPPLEGHNQGGNDDIVFETATVKHYPTPQNDAPPVTTSKNIFGEDTDTASAEEERLNRHLTRR
eukprot:TRINITY_DN9801_c0_g1_i1.p1 TRINITY_DN9801_c0_g1~~TRINITY_DN9801_c0_g1_i1.p1  ORF type:complete len:228 (-),score=41.66 TRINITY_DN9801_c0_g1_i1:52-735(-)